MADKINNHRRMEILKDLYGKDREEEFNNEKDDIDRIIPIIEEKLSLRYQFKNPFSVGGTGILFLIEEKHSRRLRALKFSRPLPEAHKSAFLIKEEGNKLVRLAHPNIIEVYEIDTLEYGDRKEAAYFIMDYIEDAMDFKKKILFEIFQEKDSILNISRKRLYK
jgi:hypothetical protein